MSLPIRQAKMLKFPNKPTGTVALERLEPGKGVNCNGRAADTVLARLGIEISPARSACQLCIHALA
jgi:hypothetical protein